MVKAIKWAHVGLSILFGFFEHRLSIRYGKFVRHGLRLDYIAQHRVERGGRRAELGGAPLDLQ